jgi:hypothetical protein
MLVSTLVSNRAVAPLFFGDVQSEYRGLPGNQEPQIFLARTSLTTACLTLAAFLWMPHLYCPARRALQEANRTGTGEFL